MMNHVVCEETGKLLTIRQLLRSKTKNTRDVWTKSLENEYGRLMQGIGEQIRTGKETMFPIKLENIPKNRKVTYAKVVVDVRPNKAETHRCRTTVKGDQID